MHDTETLLRRVAELEQRLDVLEDIDSIQRLQRVYGYYIDNRLWDEMTALFADAGAAIEIGRRGRYEGKDNVRAFLRDVLGESRAGLNEHEVINHLQLQGVVTVAPDRQRACGRWRALIQASPPPGGTTMMCAEGVYENSYVRENGMWKIAVLWWVPTFYVSLPGYESVAFASAPASTTLPPQAPSAPPLAALGRSFVPFHYRHPVTGAEVVHVASAELGDGKA